MIRHGAAWLPALALLLAMAVPGPVAARTGINVSIHGIHMDPSDKDAKDFSSASYGGGVHASFPVPRLGNFLSGSVGMELINMLSETHEFQDSQTGLRVEQQTSQNYFRLYLGPELGPQGNGFFRPASLTRARPVSTAASAPSISRSRSARGTSRLPNSASR